MDLMNQAEKEGTPFTRALLLHFPEDATARRQDSEFMLGENILVAPVFKKGSETRAVYLPGPAEWTHLWTGEVFEVSEHGLHLSEVETPIGEPAVYVRNTEAWDMLEILSHYIP